MGGYLIVQHYDAIEYVRPDMWDATFLLGDVCIEVSGNELSEMMNNLRDDLAVALTNRFAGVEDA